MKFLAMALFAAGPAPACWAFSPAANGPRSDLKVSATLQSEERAIRLKKPLGLVIEELKAGGMGARVKEVREGGAAAGKVKPGELLLTINGEDCLNKPFTEVVDMMVQSGEMPEMSFSPTALPPELRVGATSTPRPRSTALPFLEMPRVLAADAALGIAGGALAGNAGFDPLGLATDKRRLRELRDAEMKHGRLAMVAALGWPVAEALDGLPAGLEAGGLSPSLLNGGLADDVSPLYWCGVLAFTAWVEGVGGRARAAATVTNSAWLPGDLGFDPLGLYPKTPEGRHARQWAELRHGRLAMAAVVGYALQEAANHQPVLADVGAAMEALAAFAAAAAPAAQ